MYPMYDQAITSFLILLSYQMEEVVLLEEVLAIQGEEVSCHVADLPGVVAPYLEVVVPCLVGAAHVVEVVLSY